MKISYSEIALNYAKDPGDFAGLDELLKSRPLQLKVALS